MIVSGGESVLLSFCIIYEVY